MGATQKSIRIQTNIDNPQDQYLTVPFDRSIGLIEVLSLKIPMKQEFRRFDSQTGIICGRVFANGNSANNSIGVPNVKVSIFISKDQNLNLDNLSDINKTKIKTAELQYPFENSSTKYNGKRFSLLPKWSTNRGISGFIFNVLGIGNTPKQPVGSNRPELEEVLSNEDLSYLEKKYYKYSTTTNKSGDYMIYLPVGVENYEIICEVDISDIGPYSINGHQMTQVMGYPEEYFENGKLKNGVDIDVAPNIIRLTSTVTIKPLWSQNSELANNPETVGITRQDFRLPVELKANFTIFGSTLNMKRSSWYFDNIIFHSFLYFTKLRMYTFEQIVTIIQSNCDSDGGWFEILKVGNCGCGTGTGKWGGFKLEFKIDFKICFDSGSVRFRPPSFKAPSLGVVFRFGIRSCLTLPSVFPGFKIRIFTNRPCVMQGSDYQLPSSGLFYLGQLELCREIGQIIGDDHPISDLLSNSDRIDKTLNRDEELINAENIKTEIKLFSVKNDIVNKNPDSDIELINDSQYVKIIDDGSFILNINTNKKKMINSEDGTLIETSDDSSGIFTEFDGYCIFKPEIELGSAPNKQTLTTLKMKVPQNGNDEVNIYNSFQNFKFGEFYSVSQFIPNLGIGNDCNSLFSFTKVCNDYTNLTGYPHKILTPQMSNDGINNMTANEIGTDFGTDFNNAPFDVFRGDFLNFMLYFVNIGYRAKYGQSSKELSFCSNLVKPKSADNDRVDINLIPNNNPIGGGLKNTQYMSNPNNIITQFIKVDKTDLVRFLERNEKRYETSFFTLKEPQNYPSNFFYKGKFGVDSVKNLINKNII